MYNHQGIETPDGIIVEMHGPFEGRTNDKRMMWESQLLERMAASFPGYLWLRLRGPIDPAGPGPTRGS